MLERIAVAAATLLIAAHGARAQSPDPEIEGARRVAVYLDDGRRLELTVPDATRLSSVLRDGGLAVDRVVAAALVPRDRLLDGVLIGAGIGVPVALGYLAAIGDSPRSAEAKLVASLYGFAFGAGLGAMLDAGVAKPERLIYARSAAGATASASRRWNLVIPPETLAGWVRGRKVDLMLRDGTHHAGKVTAGDERRIELSARGRSTPVANEMVSTVIYRENIGGNRFAATLGAGLTGLFSGVLLGGAINDENAAGIIIGGGVGTLVGAATGFGVAEHQNWREITLTVRR